MPDECESRVCHRSSSTAFLHLMHRFTRLLFGAKRASLCAVWLGAGLLFAMGLVIPAGASQIDGLQKPQSFVADPSGEFYFISNINGEPDARDNNGFITKVDKEGKVASLHFIQGGQNGTTLDGPKGMAIVGRLLYVVDIGTLRAFDKETGKPVVTVPLKKPAARDIA